MQKTIPTLLDAAQAAADLSRQTILSYYNSSVAVETKLDNTPVTIADRKAEEEMRRLLRSRDSGYGFIGEEFGRELSKNGVTWVMDPIDGTKSFIRGVPLFGTLLAAFQGGRAVVGVIDLPALSMRLWATRDGGAWLDGNRVTVSDVKSFQEATLLTGTVNTFESAGLGERFHQLRRKFGLYRGWGDCFGYFQVAAGRAEAMIDPIVSIWDVAPLELIFTEAGGLFSDLSGSLSMLETVEDPSVPITSDNCTAVASNGLLHSELLQAFRQ